ncbi:MAG: hypothetical protein HUU31_14450 [Anaerolineae bacterium]|nr:hypothetical protein [Anaerolineae bacterium]
MPPDIDLTRGGYGGDIVEEMFKPFTAQYMDYWWHFREVLRPGQERGNPHWHRIDGNSLTDDDWKPLIALSMTNYAVYTGLAEALGFFEQMRNELYRTTFTGWRVFEVRRAWKAMYSSLYSSFTALSNVICMVVGKKPIFKNAAGNRNYDPGDAKGVVQTIPAILTPFGDCQQRLEIRNQLDHYWLIWHGIEQGQFFIDRNFSQKAHLVIDPANDAQVDLDAYKKAQDDLINCASNFNLIYKEMAITGGYLDAYFAHNGWYVEYSDYGKPHNQMRPKP